MLMFSAAAATDSTTASSATTNRFQSAASSEKKLLKFVKCAVATGDQSTAARTATGSTQPGESEKER